MHVPVNSVLLTMCGELREFHTFGFWFDEVGITRLNKKRTLYAKITMACHVQLMTAFLFFYSLNLVSHLAIWCGDKIVIAKLGQRVRFWTWILNKYGAWLKRPHSCLRKGG